MRKALYILAELEDQDLLWLVETGSYRNYPSGTTLIEAEKTVDHLYIVIDGELDVILPPQRKIGDMGTGDIVGEMSLIEKRPPSVSVVMAGDSKLLAVPHAAINGRLRRDTAFAARFYRALTVFLADRLRTRVATLGYGEARIEDAQESFERENELDESLLDSVHVAGDRMRRLIGLLEGNPG